jgi:hypothetical protein
MPLYLGKLQPYPARGFYALVLYACEIYPLLNPPSVMQYRGVSN